jgi:RHS repeat-associated protein
MENNKEVIYNKKYIIKDTIRWSAGGNYEEVINHETGKTTKYHYIHGGSGLAAVFIAEEDSAETDNLYYIHKDYLGSILCLSDEDGKAVERYSFDAWGHRRNPTNWSQWQGDSTDYIVNRGFTGHEHMDIFGLINMNGRIYDPDLGRFISPDPYVQMPDNSQNFNRYSYALNNPLKYTDPSGDNIQPHPRYDSWEKNITGAGRGFIRVTRQYNYDFYGSSLPSTYLNRKIQNNVLNTDDNDSGGSEGDPPDWGIMANSTGVAGSGLSLAKGTFRLRKSGRFSFGYYKSGWSTGNQYVKTTYSISKLGSKISTGANIVTTGMAYHDIATGNQQPITYVDAGVGTAGMIAQGSSYFAGVQIPYIGEFVAVYGVLRLTWDIFYDLGARRGPSTWYGTDDTKWFE